MRQSRYFAPTLRDVPADAEIKSHQLLLRAGYIKQNAAGVYSYLPLGYIVLKKIEEIVREEMNKAGGQELLMPAIQPAELWHETGRWDVYGPELMRLKDRHDRDFALGATHEELITSLVRDEINTYKKMPALLYQIQTKYRDEQRPRFGLLRGREFIMKDAYSFDSDEAGVDKVYETMVKTYETIFKRCGLNFRAVVADSGAIGGTDTHEFMALSDVGEDTIAYSLESDYAANIEMAPVHTTYEKNNETIEELRVIPSSKADEMTLKAEKLIQSSVFRVGDECVLVLTRGDHTVNDVKVKHLFQVDGVEELTIEQAMASFKLSREELSPLNNRVKTVADNAVGAIVNGMYQKDGEVVININPDRDLYISDYADLRMIEEGDPSPCGKGKVAFAKGIEIGQVFKLGTRYSEAMNATFLDESGKEKPIVMGCYGIGISRTMAAVVEQHHDEQGIIWPLALAPFAVHLIAINPKNEAQKHLADKIYSLLQSEKIDVLYDDRAERAGAKFADSDLIGIPLRIIVGKRAADGIVEVKKRKNGESLEVSVAALLETLKQQFDSLK